MSMDYVRLTNLINELLQGTQYPQIIWAKRTIHGPQYASENSARNTYFNNRENLFLLSGEILTKLQQIGLSKEFRFTIADSTQRSNYYRLTIDQNATNQKLLQEFFYKLDNPQEKTAELNCQLYPHHSDPAKTIVDLRYKMKAQYTVEQQLKNVIFLLDRSGSMEQDLPLLIGITDKIIRSMDPNDTVSVIQFNYRADVLFKNKPLSAYQLEDLGALKAEGNTDLLSPFECLTQPAVIGGKRRTVVVLVTDGKHKEHEFGWNSELMLKGLAESVVNKTNGVNALIPVGIGAGYSEVFMQQITNLLHMPTMVHIGQETDYPYAEKVIQVMCKPHSEPVTLVAGAQNLDKGRLVVDVPLSELLVVPTAELQAGNFQLQLQEGGKTLAQQTLTVAMIQAQQTHDVAIRFAKQQINQLMSDHTLDDSAKQIVLARIKVDAQSQLASLPEDDLQKIAFEDLLSKAEQGLAGQVNAARQAAFHSNPTQGDYYHSYYAAQPLPSWRLSLGALSQPAAIQSQSAVLSADEPTDNASARKRPRLGSTSVDASN